MTNSKAFLKISMQILALTLAAAWIVLGYSILTGSF